MLPEMVFGHNILSVSHKNGLKFSFCAKDALAMVESKSNIKVKVAEKWAQKLKMLNIEDKSHSSDWTFTTFYEGTLTHSPQDNTQTSAIPKSSPKTREKQNPEPIPESKPKSKPEPSSKPRPEPSSTLRPEPKQEHKPEAKSSGGVARVASTEGIDVKMLMKREKIVWYKELCLYEDELADNGLSKLDIKIRVMPSCFLLRMRFLLRVDDVTVRARDVRYFHDFDKNHVIVEIEERGDSFRTVNQKLYGKNLRTTDPEMLVRILQLKAKEKYKISLSGS
ncbi:hypothetical protein AAMO2058_000600700 [Amorphochlora amoebiformis]